MLSDRRSKIIDRCILAIASCTFIVTCVLLLDDDLLFKLQKNRALPGSPIAKITNSEKDVRRRLDGDIIWFPIRQKTAVFQDDSIFTGDSSRTDVLFDDKTSLAVGAQSLVRISVSKGQTTLQLVNGSMRVKVAPHSKIVLVANGKAKTISGKDAVAEVTVKPKQDLMITAVSGTVDVQEGIVNEKSSAAAPPVQKLVAALAPEPPKAAPPVPATEVPMVTNPILQKTTTTKLTKTMPAPVATIPAPLPVPTPAPEPPVAATSNAKPQFILDSNWTFLSSLGVYSYSGESGISGLTTASDGIAAKLGVNYEAWFSESWGAIVSGNILNLRNLTDSNTLLKTVSIDMNYQWLNPAINEASQTSTKWRSSIGFGLGLREDLQVNTPTTRTFPMNLGFHWRANLSKRFSSAWAFESTLLGLVPLLTTQSGTGSDSIGFSQPQLLNLELQAVIKRSVGKNKTINFGLQTQQQTTKYVQAVGTTSNQFTTIQTIVSFNLGL